MRSAVAEAMQGLRGQRLDANDFKDIMSVLVPAFIHGRLNDPDLTEQMTLCGLAWVRADRRRGLSWRIKIARDLLLSSGIKLPDELEQQMVMAMLASQGDDP